MSLLLLWTFVFFGQEAQASTSADQHLNVSTGANIATEANWESNADTLKNIFQCISHEATPSVVFITLQPVATTPTKLTFAFPTDEPIHPSAARAPGVSYLSKFFSTSIQPNAP